MKRLVGRHPVVCFFLFAWLSSWAVMIPLALAKHGVIAPLPRWLHYLSAYGPMAAAALVIGMTEGADGLRSWRARLLRWRVGIRPWVLAVSPLVFGVVAAVVERVARGAWPDWVGFGKLNFLPYLGPWAALLWVVNSGLGEEAGWRGYALPALQRRFGPRVASLIVAGGWMIWHTPAFFYLPSYERLGAGMVIGFFFGILAGSYFLTWLSLGATGSALLPIVWHGLFNFTTAPPSSGATIAPVISTVFTILGVVAFWRLRRPSIPTQAPSVSRSRSPAASVPRAPWHHRRRLEREESGLVEYHRPGSASVKRGTGASEDSEGGVMAHLELHAHLKIRPGQLEGFKAQVAEILRLTRELDTQTIRYDWFINEDGTECEVHEVYLTGEGLVEHNMHVMEARAVLFEKYAYDHRMTAFGEVSQELRELAKKHAGGIAVYSFLQGLETHAAV